LQGTYQFCDAVRHYFSGTNIILYQLASIHKKAAVFGFETQNESFLNSL